MPEEGFTAADYGDAFGPKEPRKPVSNYSNRREWHATVGVDSMSAASVASDRVSRAVGG